MIERLEKDKLVDLGEPTTTTTSAMSLPITEPLRGINRQESFPLPRCAKPKMSAKHRKIPNIIAHRGYKARYPENTLRAFRSAIEDGGANAIETDIHLSKDDVVVLSHDRDLKRCYGKKKTKIIDCDWSYLSELRTVQAPHEPMPRLRDLLQYISQPELQEVWILLDIKLDNDADKVMRLIAETLDSVESGQNNWRGRIVLGIWTPKYLPLCVKYLPGYSVTHIGFSLCYARNFLQVPNVSFNMFQKVLVGPLGARFIRDVKAAGRPLFTWTVNDRRSMKWCIEQGLDGVITNDPLLLKEVCDEWTEGDPEAKVGLCQWLYSFWLVYVALALLAVPMRRRFPGGVEAFLKSEELRARASMALDA